MSDFALFEKALAKYEKIENSEEENIKYENENSCSHKDVVEENDIVNCLDCGEEIQRKIMHEKEWRYYGSADSKRSSDPNRVQIRKSEERNINKDVENMGFSQTIVNMADELYSQVTKGQIYRGTSRRAVVFACMFHSYKLADKHQMPKNLMEIFNLSKKSSLKGMKTVNVNAPKNSKIHTTFITPIHLIGDIMNKFKCTPSQEKEVVDLFKRTKNRSSKLNRARPQSVAAALIYYWICLKKLNISLKEFAKKADLSELTINKNAKEVAIVLRTPDVV